MLLKTEQPVHRRAISLTPLIDVVFILLLFFMLSSTFIQWRQIDVSAAMESATTQAKELRTITLINDKGDFTIGGQTFSSQNADSVKTIVAQQADAVFVISVEPGVKTQSMINLLDAFKQAGAASVTLAGVN